MIATGGEFWYEVARVPTQGETMARSKSKHRRVRHKIRLKWKKRLGRKKAAAKKTTKK